MGSYLADLFLQAFGLCAFLLPITCFLLSWKWLRSEPLANPGVKTFGMALLFLSALAALGLAPSWTLYDGAIHPGGVAGLLLAGYLRHAANLTGAVLLTATSVVVSIYILTSFTMEKLGRWLAGPLGLLRRIADGWVNWLHQMRQRQQANAESRAAERRRRLADAKVKPQPKGEPQLAPPLVAAKASLAPELVSEEIPICPLVEETPPWTGEPTPRPPIPDTRPLAKHTTFELPSTELLAEPAGRTAFD
ncbi:MAG: DNA translocase FtsK 4TM domain-containing protein, partial [Acidobacteria bacterium]|nr:DNA translocase FtsK 4TM domain-containing protein [Acidobacteriota bacterium]